MSVADLVQRHTGSRPDLTPVHPDQLRQNALAPGRRARHDEQPPPPPTRQAPAPPQQPSIAAALEGADERPPRRAPQPTPREESPRRPGGTSSYFTIPTDAIRDSFSSDPSALPDEPIVSPDLIPPDGGFAPTEVPDPTSVRRPRRAPRPAPEGPRNGFPRDEGVGHAGDTSAQFPLDTPHGGFTDGARRPGEVSAHHPVPGFPPDGGIPPRKNARRVRGSATPNPGDGFPPAGGAPNGFPPETRGTRHPGEASAQYPVPGDAPRHGGRHGGEYPADSFPGDAGARHGRRTPDAFTPEAFPPDPESPRQSVRRAGEGPFPGGPAFPPDPEAPHRNGGTRRVGEASAHFFATPSEIPDGAPGRPGRRAGEASTHFGAPGEDPRQVGEGSGPRRNGGRRAAEAAGEDPRLADGPAPYGFPDEAPGRRGAESPHFGAPGDDPRQVGEGSRRNGTRRAGEAAGDDPRSADGPAPYGFPDEALGRRGAEPPHFEDPRQVGEGSGPRRNGPRRAGEASTHFGAPGMAGEDPRLADGPSPHGFPEELPGRNGRRGAEPPHFAAPGDDPRQAGEGSGPRRTGARRTGEAFTPFGAPEDPRLADGPTPHGFPDEAPGHRGAEPTHFGAPGDDPRLAGEGSGPRRNSARRGDSAHFGAPGEDPRQVGEGSGPRRNGARRAGEPGNFGAPGEIGEGPGPHGFPHEGPGPRRVGEASAPRGFPPEGGPHDVPGRPEGAARRRSGRAAELQSDLAPPPGRFPTDTPPVPPGQTSTRFPVDDFRRPDEPESAGAPSPEPKPRRAAGVPPVPPPMPPRGDDDLVSMTTEMEAIGEEVQKRRTIDHTLARFSAVHDEIKAEEREKKAKRRKLMPWQNDDEMDRLDELDAQQSMAMAVPNVEPKADEEDEDDHKGKKKRRWRKGKYAGKAFTIVVAALVFLSTAVLWGFKSYIESSAQTVDALDPNSDAIKDASAQTGDENFLLVGSDTRAGAAAEEGVGDENMVQGARSDTVMIAHIPKNRERVVVVSFPRDLEVTRPACEGWDPKTGKYTGEQHPAERRVKLNTAYQIGGPKCVTKMVQEISGLAVNHFVGIDFHGFKDMVEAVQGVEVCVERPLDDEVLGMVVPEAGKNVRLSGDQALNFVRARHVKGDPTSDYGRITRQQRFLSSLLRKAMSSEVLLNPGKLTKFVDAFSKATFGDNIGIDQLFTLGQSMQGVEAGRVTFITVPTVGEANKRGNEELRTEDTNALFEAIRRDTPLPGEAPSNQGGGTSTQAQQKNGLMRQQQPPAGQVDPKTVKLQVLNGGNETGGIAGDTAEELTQLGFQVVRVGEAEPVNTTIVKYSRSREAQAKTIQAAVPGATLVEDPSMAGAIMLIIGPEFDGEVRSPSGGGEQPELPENLATVNAGDVSCA